MATESTLRFGAQTDEVTSLLRIVNMVRTGGATTRPEIGRITGLGRGVVTQRVEQAYELGYLADGDYGPSSGGRAPRHVRFRSERGRLIVCAFGGLHIRVGIADLEGEVIDQAHTPWDIARGPAETLEKAMNLIDEVIERTPGPPIWGITVGVPGPVDFATGRTVAPPIMPGWNGFDIRAAFEQRYEAATWVDNDVNLLAFGELARRAGEDTNLIYVKIGSGIGAGLLSQGRVHRGTNGAAGDIGHVRVRDSDVLCRCGKTGCLEAVAGGWALVNQAEAAIAEGAGGPLADQLAAEKVIIPQDITRAAESGDPLSTALLQRSARIVGESIAALVNMFNPSVIVIGGVVAGTGELYLAEVRQRVYELSLPLATRDLTIVNSVNDEGEPLRGGAALAREQLFGATFPRWFADGKPTLTRVH